jgi:riboflavin synthase
MTYKIGVLDTTFARVDMAKYAMEVLTEHISGAEVVRYTVPGIKDLPVAAKRLFDNSNCDIVITFGWVGPSPVDKYSYLAMSIGLMLVQLMTSKHIIDVTVHEDEAKTEEELYSIAIDRAKKHAYNLVRLLLYGKEALTPYAGRGLRQGMPDVGPIKE